MSRDSPDHKIDEQFLQDFERLSLTKRAPALQESNSIPPIPVLKRPGNGMKGSPIPLLVNWFRLAFAKERFTVFLYKVTISEIKRDNGRGRGRGGRARSSAPQELKNKEHWHEMFWNAVYKLWDNGKPGRLIQNFDDVICDQDVAFLPYCNDYFGTVMDHPNEMINARHSVRVEFRYVGRIPIDPFHQDEAVANFATRFMKALTTQRVRFVPSKKWENWETIWKQESEFVENWYYTCSKVFRIPRLIEYNSDRDNLMKIVPGTRAWLGICAALKMGSNEDLFMNLGLVNSIFYKMDMDLITFYVEVCQESGSTCGPEFYESLKTSGMDERQRRRMEFLIKYVRVKSENALDFEEERRPRNAPRNWRPERRPFLAERHYSVLGIGDNCPDVYKPDGRTESMATIYARLNRPLRFPFLPLVAVKSGKTETYLPMEVLIIRDTPQRFVKTLNQTDLKKYIKKVCRSPDAYKTETDDMLRQLQLGRERPPFLSSYGVQLSLEWTKCEGKLAEPPVLRDPEGNLHELQGDRSYRIPRVSEAVGPIVVDVCIMIDPVQGELLLSKSEAGKFYKDLISRCKDRNLVFEQRKPQVYEAQFLPDTTEERLYDPELDKDFIDAFRDDDRDDKRKWKPKQGIPTMAVIAKDALRRFRQIEDYHKKRHIVIVITSRGLDLYGRIKRHFDNCLGVVTQVVDRDTVNIANRDAQSNVFSVHHNLAWKINGKLGGLNMTFDNPSSLSLTPDKATVMYVGIDVTHPGVSGGKGLTDEMGISLASMVGSWDSGGTRYNGYAIAQMSVKETIERFNNQFCELMADFHDANGTYPEHIVVYRDGVSDSEIIRTCALELKWIKDSWKKIIEFGGAELARPTVTFIVVQKRHSTRFIRPVENKKTKYENAPSGTVVDEGVVSSRTFDFWLFGHNGMEHATSRPAHFTVVFDEWKLTPDQIYEMTYRLCFLNFRCRFPCSLPVPVYYAHLACSRYREIYRDYQRAEQPNPDDFSFQRQQQIERALNVDKSYPGMPFV